MALVKPGDTIEGYQILSPIGRGGMGEIWLAKQVSIGRKVALKLLAPRIKQSGHRYAERFIAEAQAAGALAHPNIIAVHDVGRTRIDDKLLHYFSMEYVDGENYRQIVDRDGPVEEEQIAEVMTALADGLGYAHGMGMVHRDIKPENIMRTRDGRTKLADFGLAADMRAAAEIERDEQGRVRVMGTPHYMSPEQARGLAVDYSSDHYSLGATLFTLLTGRFPFKGKSGKEVMRAHVRQPVPDPADYIDCSPAWRALCLRLMAKTPEERLPDPQSLAIAVQEACADRIWQPGQTPGANRHQGLLLGLTIVGLLAVSGGIGWWLLDGDEPTPGGPDHNAVGQSDGADDQAGGAVAAAERFLANLSADPKTALAELRGDKGLDNPYFKKYAKARERLQARERELDRELLHREQARRDDAAARLQAIASTLDSGDLAAARQAYGALDEGTRQLAGEAAARLERAIGVASARSAARMRQRIDAAIDLAGIEELIVAIPGLGCSATDEETLLEAARAKQEELVSAEREARERLLAADRGRWRGLLNDIVEYRASDSGRRRPADCIAWQNSASAAANLMHHEGFAEHALRLGELGATAERVYQAIIDLVGDDGYELADLGRVVAVQDNGIRVATPDGSGTYLRDWWTEETPIVALAEAASKAARLPDQSWQLAVFLWFWNRPEASPHLQELSDHPRADYIAAVDPAYELARRRLGFDLNGSELRHREDFNLADQVAPLEAGLLRWLPAQVLDSSAAAIRTGERPLSRDDLQELRWQAGPLHELDSRIDLRLQRFSGFLSVSRGGVSYHLAINQRPAYTLTGLYLATADGTLTRLEARRRDGLFHPRLSLQLQLTPDGNCRFQIGDWIYPNAEAIVLPGLRQPVTIALSALRFPEAEADDWLPVAEVHGWQATGLRPPLDLSLRIEELAEAYRQRPTDSSTTDAPRRR